MAADRRMDEAERAVLDRLGVHQQFRLQPDALHAVVPGRCEVQLAADGHAAEGESIVLGAAVEHRGLQRRMLQLVLAGRGVERV